MNHQRTKRLKPLLEVAPPGLVIDTEWLRNRGIDRKSIFNYVKSGWLERVVRGVYRRPFPLPAPANDAVDWQLLLLSLQRLMQYDVHLGGLSALGSHGQLHYLNLGKSQRVHFYGHAPAWIKRLPLSDPIELHSNALFAGADVELVESELTGGAGIVAVKRLYGAYRVSSPEQAIFETLDELPDQVSFDHVDKIFEGLTMLRPKRLMAALAACQSVKVRRLFFVFADKHQHAWRKYLDSSTVDFGSGPRALVQGGHIHPIYRISVPAPFMPAE